MKCAEEVWFFMPGYIGCGSRGSRPSASSECVSKIDATMAVERFSCGFWRK